MKNYQYILLDWDGNLAKTLDIWLEAIRQILHEEGYHPSDGDIAASFGKSVDYFGNLGIANPEAVYNRVDQLGKGKLTDVELYPDAFEVLSYFRSIGKKTALITTSPHVNIDHLLDRYELHAMFDVVITRDEVTEHKPHPEPLLKALEGLGGNVNEAIMIGDSDKDLGAANNAGVDSVLFYPPEHGKFYNFDNLKLHKPTYIVEDFRQVMEIVK